MAYHADTEEKMKNVAVIKWGGVLLLEDVVIPPCEEIPEFYEIVEKYLEKPVYTIMFDIESSFIYKNFNFNFMGGLQKDTFIKVINCEYLPYDPYRPYSVEKYYNVSFELFLNKRIIDTPIIPLNTILNKEEITHLLCDYINLASTIDKEEAKRMIEDYYSPDIML
ncbi:MAG: hypothetical protein QW255_04705 [Candidatus Bilamarchaeaceae archaeon]